MKCFNIFLLVMAREEQEAREILQEIEALFIMHQGISQSSECREFSRRVLCCYRGWKTQDSPG